jgi:hypothetical protein
VERKSAGWVESRYGLLIPRSLQRKSRRGAVTKAFIGLALIATQVANFVSTLERAVADATALVRELLTFRLP